MPKFEENIDRLEQIAAQLERGEIALEEALALFEEGMKISSACRQQLDEAEGRIEILIKQQSGKLAAEPFDRG
jgi:exodeoxyribonuclease VII small subunit